MSRKPLILVVDDDPAVRRVVRDALALGGFETRLAADGVEALRAAEEVRPDLVVLDLGMPGMSGYELLERLQRSWPGIPVVILSGMASPQDAPQLMDRGARAIVGKPFGAREFLRVVSAALDEAGPAPGAQ